MDLIKIPLIQAKLAAIHCLDVWLTKQYLLPSTENYYETRDKVEEKIKALSVSLALFLSATQFGSNPRPKVYLVEEDKND